MHEVQPGSTFVIDPLRVVHETVDDETIVIDLLTGTYYSITGCGVELWSSLAVGTAVGAAVGEIVEARDSPADGAEQLLAFVTELVDANLLEPGDPEPGDGAHGPDLDGPTTEASATGGAEVGARAVFVAPLLSRYSDMQALLLLDPVHEVDAAGWPHLPDA